MIYYEFSKIDNMVYISKNEVSINKEKLAFIREEIKKSCSEIIHHSYKGTSFHNDEFDEVINLDKVLIGVANKGLYKERLYKIDFDEIKYPAIVNLLSRIIVNPKEEDVTLLLDMISEKDFDNENTFFNNNLKHNSENEHERYNNFSGKNKVEDFYPDIKECFSCKITATLPLTLFNSVSSFFDFDSENNTNKFDNTLKRSKKLKKNRKC